VTWEALSSRVVMVSRYAERDGITRYAEQLITAHSDGREFLRLGIPDAPGDYPRAFQKPPWALWLLRDAGRRDDVVLQYHPHYYIRGSAPLRIAQYASWGVAGLLRRIVFVSHEPDPPGGRIEEFVRRWTWRRARQVVFHSEWERKRWADRYGKPGRQAHVVVEHGDFFVPEVAETRAEARAKLGLEPDRTILLMIGFLSKVDPDKGYDRAVAAVRAAADPRLQLHIVGTPIRPGPETEELVRELRAAAGDGVHLHEEFVDDEGFDRWVRAADAVLTPYRTSSSSGVVARAQLLGTPVITSDVGGLPEQAGPNDFVVRDDEELLASIRRLAP
jgi:glycosyltransferase involved in cell wall biosynthesis